MTGTPVQQEGPGKLKKKNAKRGDLEHFGLIRGKLRDFFHV